MSVAKTIELSSESSKSFEDAIEKGVSRAGESLRNVQQAWVKDQIVLLNGGKVQGYRVHMNVTFAMDE